MTGQQILQRSTEGSSAGQNEQRHVLHSTPTMEDSRISFPVKAFLEHGMEAKLEW